MYLYSLSNSFNSEYTINTNMETVIALDLFVLIKLL